MKSVFFFIILSALFICGACTISQKNRFEDVKVGMEKTDVLLLLDSPQISRRWHGMDRWTYIFWEDNVRYEKEVHFQDGKAAYVGETYKPELSAEERDKKNEQENLEVEKLAQSRKEEARKSYIQYQEETQGTDQKIRYVPEFKPVQ